MLSNLIDKIKLPFRKDRELISSLYDILGFYPHKMAYYKLALMHKSLGHRSTIEDITDDSRRKGHSFHLSKKEAKKAYGGKKGKGGKDKNSGLGRKLNNERLEFLGDAILDAIVGDIVYRQYPGKPEGFLTNTRSKLVQRETLGKLAQQMGISRLILSSGRNATHNSYMGGNAFEALFGAIYLDRGYDTCYKFWEERILGRYINIDKMAYKEVNFKSKLIEWTQKNRIELNFRLEEQTKDDNGSPVFVYTVVLETVDGETGKGFSKKESQQHACEQTLRKLKSNHAFLDSVFAAKTERTKMDEDMVQVVPDTEKPNDTEGLVIEQENPENSTENAVISAEESVVSAAEEAVSPAKESVVSAEKAVVSAEKAVVSAEEAMTTPDDETAEVKESESVDTLQQTESDERQTDIDNDSEDSAEGSEDNAEETEGNDERRSYEDIIAAAEEAAFSEEAETQNDESEPSTEAKPNK